MNEMLQAVKGITTEANFLFKAALGIGFLIFSVKKAIDNQTSPVMEFGKLLLLGGVTWNLFLSSSNDDKHRFMVYDEVTSKSYVISQLLVGMGVSFALMSNFERVVLKSMEKHFSTPQSTNFSNAGLGFSLQVMSTLPSVKLSAIDATLQKNIDFYFRNCVSVGILLNQQGRNLFQNSDNLIQDLFTNIGNGSQLTPLFENNNNIEKQSVVPCSDAGPQIVEMIKNDTDEAMKIHAALLGMANDMANYEQKFLGAAQIYNEQAVSARSYLQQSMIMLASQDAIINTAKSVGLNPASVAANTAYADQQFYASMQAQGHLAQTYLPLAKAYLTAIIIGLSWLVALLSIVFGSYAHIKMFFTLCIWIVLWTPILCIINFLNDFNLMKVAQVITGGKAALSLGDNILIFKEVASRSNFMNYLVMSTPVLAYAIAKASEQGFVTFASGLSQALTGASRAAGSFANQQALSTQTSIAAPRGDEVWAMNAGVVSLQSAMSAGVVSLQSAMSAGGGRFSMSAVTGGGTTVKDVNTNTNFALGSNGEITNMSIAGLDAKHAQSETQTRQDSLANSIADTHKTGINQGITSNYLRNHGAGVEDTKAIEKAEAQALRETMSEVLGDKSSFNEADKKALEGSVGAYASGSAGLEIFGNGGKIGGEIKGIASIGTGSTETQEYSRSLSKEGQAAFDKMYAEKLGNIIKSSDSVASAYSNALSTSTGSEFADAKQKAHSYSEASQYSEAIQTSNLPNMAENYIAENNLGGTREQQVAAAAKGLENLAARGDLQGLLHYANMNTAKPNADGIHDVSNKSYYSPSSVGANNAHNNDTVANQNSLNNLGTAGGNNIRNEFSQQSGAAISNFKNQGTSTSNVVNNSAKDAIVEQNANRRMGVNPSSYAIQDASKSGNELAKEAQGLFDAMSKK
ncbi:conjugal transfer protein TraG [Campylobacter coli]|nr:conjugal transfer protein TraG [Campylobacter coli]EFT9703605.1 conjugal transfer protein TraG [Campylobacter coli]EHC3158041.1 conjugal transfer protein TraG [Campylobacter coli]MDR37918.1 conjugal transfer protein TraG [Campylobacter coli]